MGQIRKIVTKLKKIKIKIKNNKKIKKVDTAPRRPQNTIDLALNSTH